MCHFFLSLSATRSRHKPWDTIDAHLWGHGKVRISLWPPCCSLRHPENALKIATQRFAATLKCIFVFISHFRPQSLLFSSRVRYFPRRRSRKVSTPIRPKLWCHGNWRVLWYGKLRSARIHMMKKCSFPDGKLTGFHCTLGASGAHPTLQSPSLWGDADVGCDARHGGSVRCVAAPMPQGSHKSFHLSLGAPFRWFNAEGINVFMRVSFPLLLRRRR